MFAWIDWNNLQLFHYFAIGGGVVLVLALLLYLIPGEARKKLKLPAIVVGVVGGLAVGFAAGALGMAHYRDFDDKKQDEKADDKKDGNGQPGPAPGGPRPGGPRPGGPGGGFPGGGFPGGGFPGGGFPGGGGGGQTPQQQLGTLVHKLDLLTGKSLTITLTEDQKKKLREQLKDLDPEKKLERADADKRLKDLLKSLEEGQAKDTLEDIGFRWPREGGPGGGGPGGGFGPPGGGGRNEEPVSPFEDKKNAASLKALKERLEKQGPK